MVTIEQLKKFRENASEMVEARIKQKWVASLLNGIPTGQNKIMIRTYDVFRKVDYYLDSANEELIKKCLDNMVRDGYKLEEVETKFMDNTKEIKRKVVYLTF